MEIWYLLIISIQPKPSRIPRGYPTWASWKRKETFLPPSFHSKDSFKNVVATIRAELGDASVVEDHIDAPLLLLGLVYREVSRAMEVEPGATTSAPLHLVNSPLGVKELAELDGLMNAIEFV